MRSDNKLSFIQGLKDGVPIALGYFAVSFSLGIMAKKARVTALQGFIASLFTLASAGEYAGFRVIMHKGLYLEMALIILITNSRYFLMSCALSQKLPPSTSILHRFLVGLGITDEIFAIELRKNFLNPFYTYGAVIVAAPSWAGGTSLGIVAGSLLPSFIVTALSVALYGMFIAVIVPVAKSDKVIMLSILTSFLLSFLFSTLPYLKKIAEPLRIILLTVLISALFALIKPVKDKDAGDKGKKEENLAD